MKKKKKENQPSLIFSSFNIKPSLINYPILYNARKTILSQSPNRETRKTVANEIAFRKAEWMKLKDRLLLFRLFENQ